MKSALKKSVVSTSISLILASGMAAFAAHAADDVKLKATKTNVAFSDFTPTEYSTKGKPNIIVLTMDDLGYGQLPFDKGSFDPKTMENREVVDTYKIGIDKAIEAAQKSTPTLLSLMDEVSGQINLGGLMKSRQAFMLVSNNLSWFIYKYDELAELAAVIDRLYEFHQLTEQRPTNKPKNCQHAVQVADASIRTPDNKIILENLNFHVSPGKWLLLKGYSGAGKTTLLKTLSHCWPWFKGDISSPADSWYVSQTPLIKTGLLKEIICKALPLPVDDKSLSEVLHQVGLGKLAARIHDHDRWGDILSSGEKQRIALARLILRRPKWIFLDETTSHLEEQEAIRLLRLVREKLPTSGVIMVTHQPGVWNLADDICDISAVL